MVSGPHRLQMTKGKNKEESQRNPLNKSPRLTKRKDLEKREKSQLDG